MTQALAERAPHHAKQRLYVNCRNAERIASVLTLVCNLNPGYKKTIQDVEGAEVEPLFWNDEAMQKAIFSETLTNVRSAFGIQDIVVLSTRKDVDSCAAKLAEDRLVAISPLRTSTGATKTVRYATIHAFKGLEAPAIVVTDITSMDDEQRSLLYVAMSRARVRLILLMRESCRDSYKQLLLGNRGSKSGREL